jgi:hypothetical protein
MSVSTLKLNLVKLVVGAVAGPIAGSMIKFPTQEEDVVQKSIILAGFCAAAIIGVCAFAYFVGRRDQLWVRPSLMERTYFSGHPLQSFFLAACTFLAMSLGCFVGLIWIDSIDSATFFLSLGAGCMAGTLASAFLFKDRLLPESGKEEKEA